MGFRIRPGFNLPPMMFEPDELEAIRFGVPMVQAWAGPELAKSTNNALEKIQAALPEATHLALHHQVEQLVVPSFHQEQASQYSDEIRYAIKQNRMFRFDRLQSLNTLARKFKPEVDKSLEYYLSLQC